MRLSAIARSRTEPFERTLTEFLLERLVVRLTSSKKIAAVLVFKGGYVSKRAYASPSYTTDLDALLQVGLVSSLTKNIIECVEKNFDDGTWFRFEETQDLQTQGEYPGVRFIFRAGLGAVLSDLKKAQVINFDMGTGDFVEVVSSELQSMLEQKPIGWNVYSKEVIVAEKLHSFLSRPLGNSRSKDLYDLKHFLPHCDKEALAAAIRGTFAARRTELPKNLLRDFSSIRTENLKSGWQSAIVNLESVGSFDEVFKEVVGLLQKAVGS